MGVIDFHRNYSFCLFKPSTYHRPSCAFEGNKRRVLAMTSTLPAEQQVIQGQQQLTGDSFIRAQLRKLSPHQSILPFEVLSSRLERKPEDIIKLDANENPYGPPPEVFEALGA